MLPQVIQRALQEGPQQWCANWCLNRYRKEAKRYGQERAALYVARVIWDAHRREVRDGHCWRTRKPGQKWSDIPPSPHVEAKATMAAIHSRP